MLSNRLAAVKGVGEKPGARRLCRRDGAWERETRPVWGGRPDTEQVVSQALLPGAEPLMRCTGKSAYATTSDLWV